MEMPNVRSTITDASSGVSYHVLAYRKLSQSEVVAAARHYHLTRKSRKRLKPGTQITIISVLGYDT